MHSGSKTLHSGSKTLPLNSGLVAVKSSANHEEWCSRKIGACDGDYDEYYCNYQCRNLVHPPANNGGCKIDKTGQLACICNYC